MEEEKSGDLVQSLIELVGEIASISEYKCMVKKQYCNLARRLKLLTPMFEEIRDSKEALPQETVKALASFRDALQSARDLLRFGSEGSKIYLVCACYSIMNRCLLSFACSFPYFFSSCLVAEKMLRSERKVSHCSL